MNFEQYREELKKQFDIDINDFKPELEGSTVKKEDIVKHELENLVKGIKVEREHTSNNMIALEVALAHLNEGEEYYNELEKMEKKLDETISTGSVASIETPVYMNADKKYKNWPAFDLTDEEFRNFIKRKTVPIKAQKFMTAQKTGKVYLLYNGMSFNLEKIFYKNDGII